MARSLWIFAAMLLSLAGCSRSVPGTPTERGLADVRAGRWDAAIEACGEAIGLDPRDAQAYLIRGRAYHCRNTSGDLDRALADFSQAVDLAPENAEAYYSRSLAHRDRGDAEHSAEDLKKWRQLDVQVKQTYDRLPDVAPPLPDAIAEQAPSASTAESGDTKSGNDVLQRGGRVPTGSATDGFGTRERDERRQYMRLKEKYERDEPGRFGQSDASMPSDDQSAEEDRFGPRSRRPLSRSTAADASNEGRQNNVTGAQPGDQDLIPRQPRGRRPTSNVSRAFNDPRQFDTLPPVSPWAARGSASESGIAPGPSPSPYQVQPQSPFQAQSRSPFAQQAPRPTGFVEDPVQGPFGASPRSSFSTPYQSPAVRPFGSTHSDFNP